ncbi:PDZ domain,C2 domain,Dbl homology (DH) domain,PH domain-like [Cinara cedri]|uniref:PDZ domain,C2 domain,Dbl homology (DH) domain,PH domain-like n=1 Tax=Cinara cedri TaxID=506608 RepID=A0A5E4MKT8_9HEMI|nr:PDZ domain,C2 domain,Dbl homology (DH) domain,PH domain-like [Cinara cedri]
MLKWTAAGQRGGTVQNWRQTTAVQVPADESQSCFTEKPRRRRLSRRMSGRHDKENSTCVDVQTPTSKTCRTRRRESLRDVSNHNSPAATTMLLMSPGGRRTKSPCTETHWMPVQKRRSGDDIFWTDDKVKRKKPCTADHVIGTPAAVTRGTTVTGTAPVKDNGQLCVSISPTEEPVQLSHKQLPAPTAAFRTSRHPEADDLRASTLIDRYVDEICMNDCTLIGGGGPGDRLSIVSPLAKRLADIRLRRSPGPAVATVAAGRKRKRTVSSDQQDDDCPERTPAMPGGKRPAAWWWQCSGGGGGGTGGLTLPDGLASPFHSSYRNYRHHQHRPLHTVTAVPPSPITPLRRGSGDMLDDDSDDYWKTPVGRPVAGFRGDSLLSTASSKTVDDEIICCSDPRSPAVLDETFTMKSRRCLSFVSPPPSDRKKQRRSLKKSTSVDKASGLEVSIGLKDLTHLTVLLKRGRNLVCADGDLPNTYIKVYLVPGKGTCHRTRIRHNSANPRFDESFTVPVSEEDQGKRILISVWHRNRSKRRSEFLGYMSFAVKNVVKKEINGTFKLVPQSSPGGRMPPHSTPAPHRPQDLTVIKAVHCNSIDEDDDVDDIEEEDNNIMIDDEPCSTTTTAAGTGSGNMSAKVKISDQKPKKDNNNANVKTGNEENKFLQYLELDPLLSSRDGKTGRTPFTITKRLSKPSGSSFGFSIAWTHPPRVERVECGLPADQADLKPGDYVVFINKTNVVMMAEDDVMELIKSCGNQLYLEVYNKTSTANRRNNQPPPRSASTPGVLNLAATAVSQSDTTVSLQEPPRRRFHIPQVTFTSENISGDMDSQLRWVHQLLTVEQQFLLCMQFGIGRYLLPLAERKDVLKSKEHAALFQNAQELLHITVDTVERIIETDWKMLARDTCNVYVNKIDQFNAEYYKYCKGIIHADCVLVDKVRNPNFLDLIKDPPIPDRRPDLFTFIHKPLEHYRNVLKCMQLIQTNTEPDDEIFEALSHIVHEMQTTYRFITMESGQTEPDVENKPLLSLGDLEARLVFTRCKPFTLNTPDRRWIFAGDLSRVEGRSVRSYWALLFSDILLFTKVSRDRVLFVTDEPLPLTSIVQTQFSVKKKDTEFRLVISNGTDSSSCHSSPAMTGCSPLFADLSGTLSRLPKNKGRVIVLRAPKAELKAAWQNLIQRQILALDKNASALDGKCKRESSSKAEPPDSPDDLLMNSLATLDDDDVYADRLKSFAESLVDERCRRMSKSSTCNKGKALHISQWIKGELGGTSGGSGWTDWGGVYRGRGSREKHNDNDDDAEFELWSQERMDAKKSEIQRRLAAATLDECGGDVIIECTAETISVLSSPDDSQRTMVPENVCEKCQKTCDINGNQQSDAFLDMDPDNKWKPSTITVSTADLSPCESFGDKCSNHNSYNNNNNNDNDEDDDDDDDEELERPYAILASSPPQQRYHHHYQQQQQQTRQRRISSTSSLDRTGINRDHSTDSLDRVEFCSTTDYRWPEDFYPITASCCLPTDEDYNYDASSEEFWGTPNSSTTSPLSVEVNYNEERKNENLFGSVQLQVNTSSTPKRRPLRLEPLIEEIESSGNNTPSYEYKENVYGEGHTLLNFENEPRASSSKDQKHAVEKSMTKNLFNMVWRSSTKSRSKRTCSESKFSTNFIRRRRIKSETSKQNKEIKLNLIESVYLILFG